MSYKFQVLLLKLLLMILQRSMNKQVDRVRFDKLEEETYRAIEEFEKRMNGGREPL